MEEVPAFQSCCVVGVMAPEVPNANCSHVRVQTKSDSRGGRIDLT